MRIPQTKQQKVKAAVHCVQALFIFIAGCLTLAVMTKSGSFGPETGFFFALCFFTVPAILYQIMVPMWSRAWRFNNVYAYTSIDVLFTILWFAASIAVAVWNGHGIAKGKSSSSDSGSDSSTTTTRRADSTKSDGTCASFGYGSESKCQVSKATVGLGIIICLLFTSTSYLSVRAIMQYRKTGVPPNAAMRNQGGPASALVGAEDPAKDVWSANIDELNNSDDRLPYDDDHAGLLHRKSGEDPVDIVNSGQRFSYDDEETLHHTSARPLYGENYAPSALGPTGLSMSANGHVQCPEANYTALR